MQPRPHHLRLILAAVLLAALLAWWRWPRPSEPPPVAPAAPTAKAEPAAFAAVAAAPVTAVPLPVAAAVPAPRDAIPGEHTVFFEDAGSLAAFIAAAEAAGLKILGTIPELLAVRVGGSAADLRRMLPEEARIDFNYSVTTPELPDPNFYQTGSLRPFRADLLKFLGVNPGNWQSYGSGITIAVLDTGWLGHDAVRAGAVREFDLVGTPLEGEFAGHGTAVAGLIASSLPAVPGLAPGSDLLSIRVLGGDGVGDTFTLAQGIITAVQNGADVINMSLGSYGDSMVLRQAIEYATAAGVVLVAASGNDGIGRVTFPAAYEQVIAVAAVDAGGQRAPFSNFGAAIDIAAPGFQVNALWGADEYVFFDGTSAAAPLVAAMAARVLQQDLASSPEQVRQVLLDQANETGLPGDDVQYGAGLLNAERIEALGKPGIHDIALADLYPAVEQSDGATFPLYISLENRGTEYVPGATLELTVNGKPYFYRFSGMAPGRVDSVQIPVSEELLKSGQVFQVKASVRVPSGYPDSRPANNSSEISLSKPGG